MPPLVWVEPAPPMFFLDPVGAVDALLLVACYNSTSLVSVKAICPRPSMIPGRFWMSGSFWVVVCGKASSLDRERRWLNLFGGIIMVVFELRIRWAPMLVLICPRKSSTEHEGVT
jgi:hypothetical protein